MGRGHVLHLQFVGRAAPARRRKATERCPRYAPRGFQFTYTDDVGSGRWLEAVIRDDTTGRLYGWNHNEIPTDCPQGIRLWPQIGAAVSDDAGSTWDNLGIILTPRDDTVSCATHHPMTNGGIGDFSVILDNNTDDADRYV